MAEDKQKNVSVMVQMQRVKLYTGCCSLKLALVRYSHSNLLLDDTAYDVLVCQEQDVW